VLLNIVFVLMRRPFSLAALMVRGVREKNAELPLPGIRTRSCAGTPADTVEAR
jgi:hypothetical protein